MQHICYEIKCYFYEYIRKKRIYSFRVNLYKAPPQIYLKCSPDLEALSYDSSKFQNCICYVLFRMNKKHVPFPVPSIKIILAASERFKFFILLKVGMIRFWFKIDKCN